MSIRIFLIVLVLAIAALLLAWAFSPTSSTPVAPTPAQQVDLSLGQHAAGTPPPSSAPAPLVPGCALLLSFAPLQKVVATGGTISYQLTLKNGGTDACDNASVSIYYADGETFLTASPAATAKGYYWAVGTLDSGKSFSAKIDTKENGTSDNNQLANEACASADNGKDSCADNLIFIGANASQGAAPATTAPPSGVWGAAFAHKEFGTWIWEYPDQMSAAYEDRLLTAAADNGFNAVYLTVDDYLAIAALQPGSAQSTQTQAYMSSLASFVGLAKEKGIAVDIEGGANDWAEPANRWKGFAFIDFLSQYNAAHPEAPVRGLQYDVESYLSPAYASDQQGVLEDFANFIQLSAARMQSENPRARFSVVIPHFYDSAVGWTTPISYQGTSEYTLTALLQALQQKPGSYLIVMAYRNFVSGDNSTEALAQAEVEEASTHGYATKVVVAQETGNVEPSYVTFYGLTKQDLYSALTSIESDFGLYSSFGGVAVHYLDPFLKLK